MTDGQLRIYSLKVPLYLKSLHLILRSLH